MNDQYSRRQFLKLSGISVIGISALGPVLAQGAVTPLIIVEQAKGIVVSDPAKCVGCGRCELACTEFNDGKAAPALSRIKVGRNLTFGPTEVFAWREGQGNWGDGLVVQELCKQCPHPVPCANACPEDAIVVSPHGNARIVDPDKCTGCKICLRACPWEMISFDPVSRKATKCFLCDGKPKCVEACPAEALTYTPWRDLTGTVPHRIVPTAATTPTKSAGCYDCHLPGAGKIARRDMFGTVLEAARGGRSFSVRELGVKVIDMAGMVLLPVVMLGVIVHAGVRAWVKR